jgi:hypothetical protein
VYPGFSVHDELAEFVAAGISPAEALKIATLGAAQYAGAAQASSLQFNLQLLWRMLSSPIVRVQLAD